MKTIAIVGTGIMGAGMARNFLQKGFSVVVWNRTKDKAADLIKLGATWAETPKVATQKADLIFEITSNDDSSKGVWMGEDGILAGADRKKCLVVSGTMSVKWIEELAIMCATKGFSFFDIPVTGGRAGAETGQLILLASGNKNLLDSLTEEFKAISKKLYYFGTVGNGTRYKLILNMLQAIHIVGLGEALKIAEANHMDMETVGTALCERPGGITTNLAWEGFKTHAEKLTFSVDWITKDLGYAKELAGRMSTPLLEDVLREYQKAIVQGKGSKDWMSINVSPTNS